MIHRRLAANLKAQNWTAIAIDFVLLVLGVFLGVLAANWNQQRLEDRETKMLLSQVAAELRKYEINLSRTERYYDVPAEYTKVALRGWDRDPSVTDRDFVIAAYQASQVSGAASDGTVMAQIFGADRLRTIENTRVREALGDIIGFDKAPLQLATVWTPYREKIRKIIPDAIQTSIRTSCGDTTPPGWKAARLPARCEIVISSELAALTADRLRSRPELRDELQWHRAAVANQIYNMELLRTQIRTFLQALDAS